MSDRPSSEREKLYRFLGRIYLMEVDAELLAALKKLSFPAFDARDDAETELLEGFSLMRSFILSASEPDLDDLAADYAKTFLAAGDATGRAAFPYETFYTGGGGIVEKKLEAAYLARGLRLMLEYMGLLCAETCGACGILRKGLLAEQRAFVEEHLAGWTEAFAADVQRCSGTDFYRGAAKMTDAFIKKETALLREIAV